MEIVVNGTGSETFTPDLVTFNITFEVKAPDYAGALEKGVRSVDNFINQILLPNGFAKTDLKTRSFIVREDQVYKELLRKYVADGFIYEQSASLRTDYDVEKIGKILEQVSKMIDAPKCRIVFGVKNEKECRKRVLALAYKDAEVKAEAIALAAGKTLRQCTKVDFSTFVPEYLSRSSFDSNAVYDKAANFSAAETIVNTFTPEDIDVSETLKCLWIAE